MMKCDNDFHWRKQLVWGILFIAVGTMLLLDRAGLMQFDLDLAQIWHYWPWLLVALGLTQIVPPTTPRNLLNGLWHIFFAGWWYVSFERIWGWGSGDTWPALVVAMGVGILLRPMLNNYYANRKEQP